MDGRKPKDALRQEINVVRFVLRSMEAEQMKEREVTKMDVHDNPFTAHFFSLRFGQRNLSDPSCAGAEISPELQPCNREPCPDRVHIVLRISQVTPLMSLEKNCLVV